MKKEIKIAVLGGGGRTGGFVVTELLKRGYTARLLLRSPDNFQIINPSIEIVKGDALDYDAVSLLAEGCHAVISTVGQRKDEPLVASHATSNLLRAMSSYDIRRYILLAGLNVDTPFDKKGPSAIAATEWMKMTYPLIHNDRQKTYDLLLSSDIDWTLVRVPFIEFTNDDGGTTSISLEDCPGKAISAASIARFMIDQLSTTDYIRQSPFIFNNK